VRNRAPKKKRGPDGAPFPGQLGRDKKRTSPGTINKARGRTAAGTGLTHGVRPFVPCITFAAHARVIPTHRNKVDNVSSSFHLVILASDSSTGLARMRSSYFDSD
jgi:hypothetical protein